MIKAYFATRNGRVIDSGFGSDNLDRRVKQAYVSRNNAAAARRGDDSKPYAVLTVEFEPRSEQQDRPAIIKSSHPNQTYFFTRSTPNLLSTEVGMVFRRRDTGVWVAKRYVGNGDFETEHATRAEAEAVFGEAEEVGR